MPQPPRPISWKVRSSCHARDGHPRSWLPNVRSCRFDLSQIAMRLRTNSFVHHLSMSHTFVKDIRKDISRSPMSKSSVLKPWLIALPQGLVHQIRHPAYHLSQRLLNTSYPDIRSFSQVGLPIARLINLHKLVPAAS